MRKILTPDRIPLLVIYVCLTVISVSMFVLARSFPGSNMGAAAPGFFPQVVSALLLALTVLGLFELAKSSPEKVVFPPRVLAAMGLSVGYIGLMQYIGYYPSTLIFVFLMMILVRDGASYIRVIVDSVLITLVSYLFFELLIDAYLPTGIIFE